MKYSQTQMFTAMVLVTRVMKEMQYRENCISVAQDQ